VKHAAFNLSASSNIDALRACAEDPSLHDNDHVATVGSDTWYRVGDLRAAQRQEQDATPPDPYKLTTTRTLADTTSPEARFGARWKAERRKAVEATRAALDAEPPLRMPVASPAELTPLPRPRSVQNALDKMRHEQ
jgi:hypothetical protein